MNVLTTPFRTTPIRFEQVSAEPLRAAAADHELLTVHHGLSTKKMIVVAVFVWNGSARNQEKINFGVSGRRSAYHRRCPHERHASGMPHLFPKYRRSPSAGRRQFEASGL